ncbi:mucin-19 [Drosophila innubila]|uniref:mucin-19 n=1 Tax=Drosophila innubila TaxID=198719 RepID=UPI00148C8BFB|nr:mucin-19 [Drosophila innubila]
MSSLEQQQQQKRPSLHFTADCGVGAGAGTGTGTAETTMSGCSPATTPLGSGAGFLPDMPQWKKDLIQRRKTNVARTNAAANSPTSTADGSCMAFTEPADSGATDANATATTIITSQQQQQQEQQQLLKRNLSQTATATTTLKTSIAAEEKSEKCFIGAGGHHTLPAVAASSASAQSTQQQQQGKDFTTVFSTETSASAATAAAAAPPPIPKQRSSLFNTRSQSTGKEQEILNLDTRERERAAFGERDVEVNNMLNSSHNRKCSRASGEVETGTATTGALTVLGNKNNTNNTTTTESGSSGSGANVKQTATSSSSANQLQTKCKPGQSVGAEAAANNSTAAINSTPITTNFNHNNITPITTATNIDNKNCKSKISDKLQSNKFIQNQQQQQQQLAASPTKVAVKTTMVAMQEMKKTTTQNGQQRHHHHLNHHHHHNVKQNAEATDVDVGVDVGVAALQTAESEDLSYGPGIVSKLRCRYLSLALRCETRQQSQQQRLQRSTSLNTLLDRNDEDDEDLHNAVVVTTPTTPTSTTPTAAVAAAVTAGAAVSSRSAAPPPILGVKPTTIASGYIKSVSVVQQQQQQQRQKQTQSQQQQLQSTSQSQQSVNGTRSRHFKRGNEVMKRARSVEALLCEKSPWNTQRASYQATTATITNTNANAASSAATAAASVTIEDKIHNARERLHSGTDAAPPKRLTSIIDDTERPPPDLVKQTLKMFEASANRRPRTAQRSNGVGGVASKVASYKSIIAEQKPISNKVGGGGAVTGGATGGAAGGLTGGAAAAAGLTVQGAAFAASTPLCKQHTPASVAAFGNVVPDIIPRQLDTFESPVSTLSKMLGRMQLETAAAPAAQSEVGGVGNGNEGGGGVERLVSDKRSQAADDDERDVENDNDDDEDNNEVNDDDVDVVAADDNNDEGDGDDVCNGDKMGAAGDKLTQAALPAADEATPTATTAAAGINVQRSFAAALQENAHVVSSINNKINKKPNNDSVLTTSTTTKQIGVIRPLLNQAAGSGSSCGSGSGSGIPLTSREIEKNRINEMKKSTALAADAALAAAVAAAAAAESSTSLDTVINTHSKDASETDAGAASVSAAAGISPIWPHLRKRRQPTTTSTAGGNATIGGNSIGNADNNTSMVFNFSKSTKEVPDYIESDVVIYRRKRELPKPNEPGFVLLGDLSVETSTDTDYDDYSMCPPSPCDVEFENANIVIDGKSSIRQKAKDSSFRVQFNDTLTSTFEYPSEASQIIDDPPYADPYGNVNKHHQLLYEEQLILQHHQQQQQQQQHHHVTVDEIIELPTSTMSSSTSTSTSASAATSHKTSATSAMLGNLPLGSTALGFYTPVKASPMDSLFQLGVTRYTPPESATGNGSSNGSPATTAATSNGGASFNGNGNGSIVGIGEGLIKGESNDAVGVQEEDYHLSSGIVYSEGTQKTDLLY